MKQKKFYLPPPVWALMGYLLTVLLIILSLKYVTLLAAPVFFSFVIAYLFNPLVNYLERKIRISRTLITGFLMITLVFLFVFLLINLFPYIIDQVTTAAVKIPSTLQKFSAKMKVFNEYITKNFSEYVGDIDLMGKIENMLSSILTDISSLMVAAFSSIYSVLLTIVYLVFIPLISFYFIKDSKQIQRSFFSLIPIRYKEKVILRMERMNVILSSFIRGQSIVILILILMYTAGLTIIGLPFAVLIGLIAGIGDIIPYFGTVIGFIISLIIGFTHYQSMEGLLLIMLVFVVVKGTENWYFYPKIVGKEVGLHFVWVLVSIVVFGRLFGFWGLLVAIPSAAGLKLHVNEILKYYKNSNFFRKGNHLKENNKD